MSKKQVICYFIIGAFVLLAVLFVLAMFNIWIMLLFVFFLVLGLGLVHVRYPDSFASFHRDTHQMTSLSSGKEYGDGRILRPTLILVSMNAGPQEQIVVDRDKFTIGRGEACDYVLRDTPSVSRFHATILMKHDCREAEIVDNRSQNGTFLNNLRLKSDTPKKLASGDILQLGELRFSVQFAQL